MTHIQLIEVQLAASRGQGCSKNATNNHVDIGYSLMFLSRSYLSCRIILFKVILIPSRTSCRWFTMNIYIYTPETKLQNVSQYKTLTQHNTILCISCVCPNSNLATKRWTTMVRPQGGDVFSSSGGSVCKQHTQQRWKVNIVYSLQVVHGTKWIVVSIAVPIDHMVVMALEALVNVLFQPLNNCWTTYIAANDAFFSLWESSFRVAGLWALAPFSFIVGPCHVLGKPAALC